MRVSWILACYEYKFKFPLGIRISIETQDLFTQVKAIFFILGKVIKSNDALYADADVISLISNIKLCPKHFSRWAKNLSC